MSSYSSSSLKSFIDTINQQLNEHISEIPKYIGPLLFYNGFDNLISLSKLSVNENLVEIETYTRNTLSKVLNEDDKKEIFGIFFNQPSLFSIPLGHKKCLEYIQQQAVLKLKHNKRDNKQRGKQLEITGETYEEEPAARKTKHLETVEQSTSVNTPDRARDRENQNAARKHIETVANSYIENFLKEKLKVGQIEKDTYNEINTKTLKVTLDGSYSAKIECSICSFKSSAYSVQNSSKGRKWILSNFLRHFRTHFACKIKGKESKNDKTQSKTLGKTLLNFFQSNSQTTSPRRNGKSCTLVCNPILPSTSTSMSDESTNPICETECETWNEVENVSNLETIISTEEFFQRGSADSEANEGIITDAPREKWPLKKNWNSRESRKTRSWNTLPYNQLQITSFLNSLNDVLDNNAEVVKALRPLTHNDETNKQKCEPKLLLKHLLDSAIENSSKTPNLNKYQEGLKRFCTYIYMTAGKKAYEILHANLKNVIPSLSALHRDLDQTDNILEGAVRLKELRLYLENRNYPLTIFISEDQTALVKCIQYDPSSNSLIGLVSPLQKNTGFPVLKKFQVNTLKDIENSFQAETAAINAYVYMAQPLVDGAPAFCISVFGSDNCFTSNDVLTRWRHIQKEASKYGITVLGIASDGDTRCMKAMKIHSKLGILNYNEGPYNPYFCVSIIEVNNFIFVTNTLFFQVEYNLNKPAVIQDICHIGTKLKNVLLNTKKALKIGHKTVSAEHLRHLVTSYSKDKHFLCESYLERKYSFQN